MVEGKSVNLKFDWQRRDKYNRILAYVYLQDGTLINKTIIEEGYGHAYTKYPFKYLNEFRQAEKKAREAKKGLWGSANSTRQGIKVVKNDKIPASDDDQIVYITKTGAKYHTGHCRYLKRSKIPIKFKDAVAAGYTPCKVCNPLKFR